MAERASLDAALAAEMARWEALGLRRELAPAPAGAADFASNDYLGLARDPRVLAAARSALEHFGAGGRAARLLGGGCPADGEAERAAARWLGAETALLFPSGYQANLGVITALAGPGDLVLSDERNHASLIDAARLSRARVAVYGHGDTAEVGRILATAAGARRVLVATETVFSMDGDRAPIEALAGLCARHGAWLVLDEAHACGLVGPAGAGAWAVLGPEVPQDVLAARVVTGGKALGVAGAFAAGSAGLREHLVNRARTFLFTTAVPPAVSGALAAAIEACAAAEGARERARSLARRLARSLELPEPAGAIVPFVLGDAARALECAARLTGQGFHVRAVRPPSVADGSSRLRIVCHAFNTDEELERLASALRGELRPRPPHARHARRAQPLFVAGTDTGTGKTVVAALLARAAARRGAAAYWKPVQTGRESDTREAARLAGVDARGWPQPTYAFALAASPHEAAAAENAAIDVARLDAALEEHLRALESGTLVVELAGGLLVPLTDELTQLDWLARHRPPLVLVARSGLGTLNHTLLSLEALRARHLEPRALFLVGAPHPSNRETLRRLGGIPRIFEVAPLRPLEPAALDDWLERADLSSLFAMR
ncbi:MAG TPA: dethiobiotin synthase [Planctomycetota bacterium]|nr:dethiobiotin synthase [Planctomycetota bacterium]